MQFPAFFRQRRKERQLDRKLHRKVEKTKYVGSYVLLMMVLAFFIGIYALVAVVTLGSSAKGLHENPRRLGSTPPPLVNRPQSVNLQLDETVDSTTKDKNQGISNSVRRNDDDEEPELVDVGQDDQAEAEASENEKEDADDDSVDSEKAEIKTQEDDDRVNLDPNDKAQDDDRVNLDPNDKAKDDDSVNLDPNDKAKDDDSVNLDPNDKAKDDDRVNLDTDDKNKESEDGKGDDDSTKSESKDWNDDNVELNRLWFGRPSQSIESSLNLHDIKISIVLSYCHGDLYWLSTYLGDFKVRKFTVVSKCGTPPKIDKLPQGVEIIEMSNVGRCDHVVAHWMGEVLPVEQEADENEVILFLKDNIIVHQEGGIRDLSTMLASTLADGLGCGLEPSDGISVFHATEELIKFSLEHYYGADGEISPEPVPFKSKFTNMGEWLIDMGISLPKPLTPVCYGGNYGVKRSQISKVPRKIWQNMERSLSRGDNIEEGHFAERTWAGLLHRPLTDKEVELLQGRSRSIYTWTNAMLGSLMKE